MHLRGALFAESPIYRGNARKTLFTRDGDGSQRLVSLAGEVAGTAEALMDAFIGKSRTGRNIGLLGQMWQRLYGDPMPEHLMTRVECRLQEASYPREHFFDLRMGIKLDEDRWAAEANANYKMETLYRHSVFDLTMQVNDSALQAGDNAARLYYLLQELKEGRFWFGGGKSKGLGRCRLVMDLPFAPPATPPRVHARASQCMVSLAFQTTNPVLVGWSWGKIDSAMPAFTALEGRLLVEALRDIPAPIQRRLAMAMAGPILDPAECKGKLAAYLPRAIAAWLVERSSGERVIWTFPSAAVAKLAKGKHPITPKAMARIQPLINQPFPTQEAAATAFHEVLGRDATKYRRVLDVLEHTTTSQQEFDREGWHEVAHALGLESSLSEGLAGQIRDEAVLTASLAQACTPVLPRFYEQMDQQIRLLQSDAWVDEEIATREEHVLIKTMLLDGRIDARQWEDPDRAPAGVTSATWREFLEAHRRVGYHHMVQPRNLLKSLANDRNFIAFLRGYAHRVRQELAQPSQTDFRAGGASMREVSRTYGKPYDTVFMRMLSWAPSSREEGHWEIYIPGSTIKGAFRRRASQVVRALWGESSRTTQTLNRLFGTQGQRGLAFFSDAYLTDPQVPERAWCAMDGVRMNPKTGQPVDEAKTDSLFAYGDQLAFHFRIDLQDMAEQDMEALSLLTYLLQDFRRGDIPLGGEKTVGFGWVEGHISRLAWMTADPDGIGKQLFGDQTLTRDGLWYRLDLQGEAAAAALHPTARLARAEGGIAQRPPRASQGFISHRAFGGSCGTLAVEVEVLTPVNVRESGEPSYRATLEDGPINGWDFFSLSSPVAALREQGRTYALPSKSLKGMLRHLYAIASNAQEASQDLSHLNPADSLFGWVGRGPNQAVVGRVSFSFGVFETPELAWFKVPYPYGMWQYREGRWHHLPGRRASLLTVGQDWRLFPHTPLAPCVKQMDDFQPDTARAHYMRAILPGARGRFTIRFWNCEREELQRLLWCVGLEEGLAHKMGSGRYLGFGSLRLRLLPDSFLIDWASRYAGEPEEVWRRVIAPEAWHAPGVINHYAALKEILDAHRL